MGDEQDSWLAGIGVDVGGVLETARETFGEINVVADVNGAPSSQGSEDESVVTVGGASKVVKTGIRVVQAVNQARKVAGAVGTGTAVAVGAAGFAVGVLAPIAIGYLLDHGEELQQQTDPDERSLPGGAPPPEGSSGGGDPLDGGAPPEGQSGDAGAE